MTTAAANLQADAAVSRLALGEPVVLTTDAEEGGSEFLGSIVFAAKLASPQLVAFAVRHTSGYLCAALGASDARRLDLPPAWWSTHLSKPPFYGVSVDARRETTTGISATDRATTLRLLAEPSAEPHDFTRPGHMVTLAVRFPLLTAVDRSAAAALTLCELATGSAVACLAQIVSTVCPTEMAAEAELRDFAHVHQLAMVRVADVVLTRE